MSGILIGLLILIATLVLGNFLRQYDIHSLANGSGISTGNEFFSTFSPLWDPNCIQPGMYCPYCSKGDCPFTREGRCKYAWFANQ